MYSAIGSVLIPMARGIIGDVFKGAIVSLGAQVAEKGIDTLSRWGKGKTTAGKAIRSFSAGVIGGVVPSISRSIKSQLQENLASAGQNLLRTGQNELKRRMDTSISEFEPTFERMRGRTLATRM